MGEDDGHNRGRRKGITLLRALVATFKWRIALAGLLMIGDSAIHIAQVGGRAGGRERGTGGIWHVFLFMSAFGDLARKRRRGRLRQDSRPCAHTPLG